MTRTDIILYLLRKGLPSCYRGFLNLVDVLLYSTEHPDKMHSIMDLYQAVSQRTGVSAASIEHNIRYLLETWHVASGLEHQPRPSNKVVIRHMTLELLELKYPRHSA